MSDVHCPICLVLTSHEANQNTEHDNSKQLELDEAYHLEYKVVCKWNEELKGTIYIVSDIECIDSLRNKITNAKYVGITQHIID